MRQRRFIITVGLFMALVGGLSAQGNSPEHSRRPSQRVTPLSSRALRDIKPERGRPWTPPRQVHNFTAVLSSRLGPETGEPDVLIDNSTAVATAANTPAAILSFPGTSDDDNADLLGSRIVPPDTNGDVGLSYYVQMNNLVFAVFDKATGQIARDGGGNVVGGPFPNNALWDSAAPNNICRQNNDGDPIALFDQEARRWILSQFAIGVDGHQCFAVSKTSDPLGAYWLYDFVISQGAFNDYPKITVWPDGYYLTANEFSATGSFTGPILVAFERDKLLNGDQAGALGFKINSTSFFSLQPSHWEGDASTAPVGKPNTFVMARDVQALGGFGADGYDLWEFDIIDWDTDNATLTGPVRVTAPAFNSNLCNFNRSCIHQPSPGEDLDPLVPFTMFRAAYRNFPTHESLLINHTVDVDGNDTAGIRWAELRRTGGGNWTLHQTGTHSPDNHSRWMGSITMDGDGNIALSYNVASAALSPSFRYVTRLAGDPLGTLGAEQSCVEGTGSQFASFNRWGDYSAISVDPVDDCTFWATGEYYEATGSFDFSTRICAFKIPSCGASCTDLDLDGICDDVDPCPGDPTNTCNDPPPGDEKAFATADFATPLGSISAGSFLDTHAAGGGVEVLIEEVSTRGNPRKRKSQADHRWTFEVQPGNSRMFSINAWRTNDQDEGDNFVLSYSFDNATYIDLLTINALAPGLVSAPLPANIGGTLYIRATDGNGTPGNSLIDALTVDEMYVETSGDAPPPPPPPPGGALTVESITLSSIKGSKGRKTGVAEVRITDGSGNSVQGANVTGHFTGAFSDPAFGTTVPGGTIRFQTAGTAKGGFGFCVTSVSDGDGGLADFSGLVCSP